MEEEIGQKREKALERFNSMTLEELVDYIKSTQKGQRRDKKFFEVGAN